MSGPPRRSLSVDDPVGGAASEPCHVARPAAQATGRVHHLAVDDVHPNPAQPRKRFHDRSLRALADSIREHGVLQPIIVQPRQGGGFELIAGERRWRASRIAGNPTIPTLVVQSVDGAQSVELALIENMARDDLGVIEEARTIAALLEELGVTAAELARRIGRSPSDLAHTVRLLDLPDEAIEMIDAAALTKGHGKTLLTEPDHCRRRALARRAVERGWSVRALEAEIARGARPRTRSTEPHADHVAAAAKLHDLLARATGCEVDAKPHRLGYQVILDQHAVDRLEELLRP
jgi:ParB family transcriptional regulator, chromosome partitioning protein